MKQTLTVVTISFLSFFFASESTYAQQRAHLEGFGSAKFGMPLEKFRQAFKTATLGEAKPWDDQDSGIYMYENVGDRTILYKFNIRKELALIRVARRSTEKSDGMRACLAKFHEWHKEIATLYGASEEIPRRYSESSGNIGKSSHGTRVVSSDHVEAIWRFQDESRIHLDLTFIAPFSCSIRATYNSMQDLKR